MKFAQRLLSGAVAGMCLVPAMAQLQKPPPKTALVYSQLYTVPEEILAGKAQEWLEAWAKAQDGIPLSKRHEERLYDVFSASLAVRTGRLDAKEWGRKLYGEDTVARQVYDTLGRIHNGEFAALPVLVDAVPEEELIGGGWRLVAHGLQTAMPRLGEASCPQAVHILAYAGSPFRVQTGGTATPMHKGIPWVKTVPDDVGEKIADAILAAEGGAVWQKYCRSLELHLRMCVEYGYFRSRPAARILIALAETPEWRHKYFTQLKQYVPELEDQVKEGYYEHRRKEKGDAAATLTLAGRKREQGAYAEALALYREAEAALPGNAKRRAWQGLYDTLTEAEKKGVAVQPTWAEEQAQREQATGDGDPGAQLAFADVLARTGRQAEAGERLRSVFAATAASEHLRIMAWDMHAEFFPDQAWALVQGHPEIFASKAGADRAATVLLYAILAGDFTGGAKWLETVQQAAPTVENQARLALLWHAAGDPEKAESLLTIPAADPKQAIHLLRQFVQVDASWSGGGSAFSDAASRSLREKLPPGRAWPLAARFTLRIIENPALRRERDTFSAWTATLSRLPHQENEVNTALVHQLSEALLGWAEEVPPVAQQAMRDSMIVVNSRPKTDTVRAACIGKVAVGAVRIMAAKGVPEQTVDTCLNELARACARGSLPPPQQKALRLALADTYPGLVSRIPEPKEE